MKPKSRVVIDTNLRISFILSKKFETFESTVVTGNFILVYARELLIEIESVFKKVKFLKILSKEEFSKIQKLIEVYGEEINVISFVDVCRDKKDNYLLSICKDGNADFLITGDKDLLVLKKFEKTSIVTHSEFLKNKT